MTDLELFRDLRDRESERRIRRAGRYFAESPTVVTRLARSGAPITDVVVSERRAVRLEGIPLGSASVTVLSDAQLSDLVGFEMHRGMIAAVRRPDPVPVAALVGRPMVAVLEGVADHQNLGAIVRAAAALGVSGVVLDPRSGDPHSRRAVRVSMGTVAHIPFARCDRWPDGLSDLGSATSIALTPAGGVDLRDVSPVGPVAVLLGAEGPGLSDPALAFADVRARIPMERGIDSLNVAHAAAIAFDRLRSGVSPEPGW